MTSKKKKVVVLGAGVSGLSAAYRLSQNQDYEVHILEREKEVGGVCKSFSHGDFILDHGPHKFYTLVPGVLDELKKIMGDELIEREKRQSLYMSGKFFDFPLRMSEMLLKFPPHKSAKITASFAKQLIQNKLTRAQSSTYEEFLVERFGKGLYEQIFQPMAEKIYGLPAELDRKLAEVRISSPGLLSVVKQLVFRSKIDRSISAPVFHYPKKGYGRIPQRLFEAALHNGAKAHLGCEVERFILNDGRVTGVWVKGRNGVLFEIPCDYLIYSIPLTYLDGFLDGKLSMPIRKAVRWVSYRHTIIYYFLLKTQAVLPSMWVFFPEKKFRFGRLSEMVKFSDATCPPGHTALMVDFTCDSSDPLWSADDKELGRVLKEQLRPLHLFPEDKIVEGFSKRFKNFYPVYQRGYQEQLSTIRGLEQEFQNLFLIGRLGDFNYNNADQCLDMGYQVADHIAYVGASDDAWQSVREQRFEKYRIVD